MQDILREFTNASADFLRNEVVGTETDQHGDEYEITEWVASHENIGVRYEETGTNTALEVFVSDATGYEFDRGPTLYAPGVIGEEYTDGDRIRVTYRDETFEFRMASLDHHTLGSTDPGIVVADLKEYGDDTV